MTNIKAVSSGRPKQKHGSVTVPDLEDEKQQYQNLFKYAPDAYLLTDEQLTVVDANLAVETLLDAPAQDLIGRPLVDFIPDANQQDFRKRLDRLGPQRKWQRYGVAVQTAAGTEFRANFTCWRIPNRLQWLLRRTTDFPHSEEDFLYAAAVLENSDDPVIGRTLDGVIVTWNRGAERVYGYAAEEALGQPISMLSPVGYEDEHQRLVKAVKRGDRVVSFETKRLKKDGSVIDVALTASPIKDDDDQIIGISAIAHDITERKWVEKLVAQAHNRVVQQRRQLRTVLAALPVGVLIADGTGRIIETNDEMGRILGGPVPLAKNMADYSAYKLLRDDTKQPIAAEDWSLARALLKGEVSTGEVLVLERLDGERVTILNSAAPIRDEAGQVVGGVAALMDITAHREAEKQAFAERERMHLLTDFVRDISHDFKTPLSTINTSLYLLQKIADPDHQKHHISLIYKQTDRLTQLLEGLLTITRLDSDIPFAFRSVSLNVLTEEARNWLASTAEDKNLTISLNLEPSLPLITADETELERALFELIQNAVQFTSEGDQISVYTYVADGQAVFEVRDTGCGIDEKDLPYIFNRLYRADKARSVQTGGVGLGLAIAKRIVEAHKGRIEVETTPGEGSTFRVFLPLLPS